MSMISIEGPGPLEEIGSPKPPRVIDWTRPVQTAHGMAVKVYAIDHNLGSKPVVGGIYSGRFSSVHAWRYDGIFNPEMPSCLDLENAPND